MAALAELPRGQALLASMIRNKNPDTYLVRFPGDGVDYVVTKELLRDRGVHNKAEWASIIECAQVQKFPNNVGAEGPAGDQSRLEIGMQCMTGKKAEVILANASEQELSAFIGGAVKSRNPVVAGTWHEPVLMSLPPLVVPRHAYTIVGLDPAKNMVICRNPHGQASQRFELPSDPQHLEFEQLDDGMFKISLSNFRKYFYSLARSFI